MLFNPNVSCHSISLSQPHHYICRVCFSCYRSLFAWNYNPQCRYKGPGEASSLGRKNIHLFFRNYFICHFWAHVILSHPQRNGKSLSDVMMLISWASPDCSLWLKINLKKINPVYEIVYDITIDFISFYKGYFSPILHIPKTFWVATSGTEMKIKINYPHLQMLREKIILSFLCFKSKSSYLS